MKKTLNRVTMLVIMVLAAFACALIYQGKPLEAKVKLNYKSAHLAPKDTLKLKVKGTKKKVKWSSSNTKTATVAKGSGNKATIKAVAAGTAYVKITLYNGKTAACKVMVK